MSVVDVPVEYAGALAAGRRELRRELLRELLRSKTFVIGAVVLAVLDRLRDLRPGDRAARPLRPEPPRDQQAPSGAHSSAPISSAATCSRA